MFEDGLRWLLKLSALVGGNEMAAWPLGLRRLPKIYSFNATLDNELTAPIY